MRKIVILLGVVLFYSCSEPVDPQLIIDQAIKKHGVDQLDGALVEFDFRKKHYSMERQDGSSVYTRSYEDSVGAIHDVLINSTDFTRTINDSTVALSDKWQSRYGNSVNSVFYFTKLPLGLNDPAVNKEYLGEVYLNKMPYHKIKVTFQQEGGGTDFQDVFIYWIHKREGTMDYLAYKYYTDGGGTRFRQAINRRTINGIIFQDYVNYKAETKNASIEDHDEFFDEGKLLELSRIVNENVQVTLKQ